MSRAQTSVSLMPIIRTSQERIFLYEKGERGNFSGINELPNPFRYTFDVPAAGKEMSVVSEKDSAAFVLRRGDTIRFRVVREAQSDTVLCEFTGVIPAVTFSDTYVATHRGKNFVEVPEVYELVNIVFMLTPIGITDQNLRPESTPYYAEVLRYFTPYKSHPIVTQLDSALRKGKYDWLKMDAYAYGFDGNRLTKSSVYDRISWGNENTLERYTQMLNDFAAKANFRRFYQQNLPYYQSLIADYRTSINIDRMKQWLEAQFPKTRYASVKAIFSPLVASNQSAAQFENNDFREAQMHINFPFKSIYNDTPRELIRARRQEIAFTELNHSYLNPEADQYGTKVNKAFGNLGKWTTSKTPRNYLDPYSCFCEYMNWALVTLYHSDHVKGTAFDALRAGVDNRMVNRRGFAKFREFDAELLHLYRNRKPGQTVADLYSAILNWAEKQ